MLIKNFCIRSQKYNFFLKFKRIFFVRLHHVVEINFLYTINNNFNLYCSNRMKKMASKIGSLFTACLVIAILLFSNSCGNKGYTPLNIDPDFAGYVISFTSGVVSKTSKVVVRLVQEMPNVKPGDELAFNPFHFSPKIKGKAIWKDAQTIEFIPEKRLESGEEYVATFSLNKFASVPKKLKKLKFNFMVMKQGIQYEFNGIEPYNDYDKKWQKVKGVFTTADYADASELEPAVEAFDHSKDYNIKWEHSPDGKTHNFTIDSVLRTTSAFEIKLKWKGEEIGASKTQKAKIEMPSIQEFKVMDVQIVYEPAAHIKVFFSDKLSKNQDITGLYFLDPPCTESVVVNGNVASIYLGNSPRGDVKLTIKNSVKNTLDESLKSDFIQTLHFVTSKPKVEFLGDGVIIPDASGIFLPFKAVSLKAVDVTIVKIFENNIPFFLQVNQLNESYEIKRVGRVVFKKEVPLTSEEPIDYGTWNNFSLDLSKLIETEPGAIYRVEISFRQKHSLFTCGSNDLEEEEYEEEKDPNASYNNPDSYWSYYEDDYYYEDYNWEEREDPCKKSYYMSRDNRIVKNVLASNMGIIAKAGSNSEFFVTVTDLRTTDPMSGVDLEFRNFQNQLITTGETNNDGMCKIKLSSKPFLIIAKEGKQRGYLRVDDGSALSLSMFDVGGVELVKGLKGFIFGERGVWRPGDSLYLSFILEDKNNQLPFSHPVVMELYTPEGQLSQRIVKNEHVNHFYNFNTKTSDDAPTGNWLCVFKVGGARFSKTIRIETVKPNRMKINLTYPSTIFGAGENTVGNLQVNWLHGSPAKNSKVVIEATLASTKSEFTGFKDYIFDDPTKQFISKNFIVFQGTVNEEGFAKVNTKLDVEKNSPGLVTVQLITKAYEPSGDFSIDRFIMKYSPYASYVGIKVPKGPDGDHYLYSDEKNLFPIVLIDKDGKPINRKLKVEIFEIYWRWWWDRSPEENLADFVSNNNSKLLVSDQITTVNGRAMYEMNLGKQSYGRKFIRITDETTGHSSGAMFYTSYKGWWSNAGSENPGGAEMLIFNTDKAVYNVGDQIKVDLPVAYKGRALVSIESGSRVIQNFWVDPEKSGGKFSFEANSEMAPNVYIHVTYIQPHKNGSKNSPIRMYGVQSVKIEDPATHLTPIISMSKVLKPLEKFSVKIKEKNGKPMTYTIAIVDEGLLDITRFKTPDPYTAFYAHEALGVKTWDLYKYVTTPFNGKLAGLLAIGGDEFLNKKGKENNNRFKPVVLFKGPISLKAGETKIHEFYMPNYVGSVKVMIVAGENGAYGNAEEVVPVKQDLMVLPTLPRIVSPTEVISVPVTVFAMDPKVKNVTVSISSSSLFEFIGESSKVVSFSKPGDQTIEFKMKVKSQIGEGRIVVNAMAGEHKATSETDLQVRLPNPPITNVTSIVIEPGKTWTGKAQAIGLTGTNSGMLEVSNTYPINLEDRLEYLITYPHGCIEQITSAAFPQLFLQNFVELTPQRKAQVEANVKACLAKLPSYKHSSGGFTYWPGDSYEPSEWGTNYAGHFMVEAQNMGYKLPVGLLDSWIQHQTKEANLWSESAYKSDDVVQAYRLYTLALAKKPALSAMNRLREYKNLSDVAKWRLAAAYALAGRTEVAKELISNLTNKPLKNVFYYYSFGSPERDLAMTLETLVLLKDYVNAKNVAIDLAKSIASDKWYSTQTTAYALLALAKYANNPDRLEFTIKIDEQQYTASTTKPMWQLPLDFKSKLTHEITLKNNSRFRQYLQIQLKGIPLMKNTPASSQNLDLKVNYYDMKGKSINVKSIKQGTDFYVEVSVKHPGIRALYQNIAIEQMFPSGWEIINTRLNDVPNQTTINQGIRYQDIRDDRVYSYFTLAKGEKKVFRILLHASFVGDYYLPAVYCSEMYDNTIYATTVGEWIQVVK